jgi:aminobenzoyl-glutamate transport protein
MTKKNASEQQKRSSMDRLLDTVERVGNKVPHPVLMFFYLMIGVIVLSALLSLLGISVTEQIAVPAPVEVTPDFYEDCE